MKLKGTIEEELGVKVLMEGTLEGVDFLKDKKYWCFLFFYFFILDNLCSVALNVKSNISPPTLCIWTVASGRAEFCYLKPQVQIFSPDLSICSKLQVVAEILSRGGWIQPCARRSARVLEQPQDDGGGDDLTPIDHLGPGQGVQSDAMVDQGPLGGVDVMVDQGPLGEVEPDQDQEDAGSDDIWDLYD